MRGESRVADSGSYDKIVEDLKKKADEQLGYASDLINDPPYVIIINVVRICEEEFEE